jgi:glycosyltransferase involved in cell wall biosynthesis
MFYSEICLINSIDIYLLVLQEKSNMSKRVSVIIPCYKDSATLGRAIESVIGQSYSSIEIIVVNDCSPETDLIEKCLAMYPQVRYLRNTINIGLAMTRNNGLSIACGEFVAFLDADDEYHQDKIAKQMEALEDNTVVTCGIVNILPNGRKVEKLTTPRVVVNASKLIYRNTLNGAGLLAPRKLLLQYGGYNSNLRSCEDFELWLRLLSSGVRVKDIGLPLYFYHYNPAGLSKNFRNISKWELEVIKIYAYSMSTKWRSSKRYASILLVWLLRHLMRYELVNNKELWRQTLENMNLLNPFPITKLVCRLVAHSRVMMIPAFLVRLSGNANLL